MKLTYDHDAVAGKQTVVFEFYDHELAPTTFDQVDWLVIADCQSDDATIADKLLALELIARRIQEGKTAQRHAHGR